MARTRAQRRRHTVLWTVALAITLVVLFFARDVARAGHAAAGPRRSENRSFAALANTLTKSENRFDRRLNTLLTSGSSLSRVDFGTRLDQLGKELAGWSTVADQLRRPALAHNVNGELNALTLERVAAYQSMFLTIARSLSLPWSLAPANVVSDPAGVLTSTSAKWNVDRYALVKEPGHAKLYATTATSAATFASSGLSTLTASPSLRLVRAIEIAALRVSPPSLPAGAGLLLEPPVTTVSLEVSVYNASYDEQPVTLTIDVVPYNHQRAPYRSTLTTTLGPLQAHAFSPANVKTAPSERATVTLTVTGAPAASGASTRETYTLELSPAGTTSTTTP